MTAPARTAAAMLIGAVLLVLPGSIAVAADSDDGLWYIDAMGVQDAHDAGITGEGITIAMIDTPVYLDVPTLEDADVRVQESFCVSTDGERFPSTSDDFETASHATQTLSLLVGSGKGFDGQNGVKGIAPDATVLTYATPLGDQLKDKKDTICAGENRSDGRPMRSSDNIAAAIHDSIDQGADIITASMGVVATTELELAIARAVREGVVVIGSVQNPSEGYTVEGQSPADLNGVLGVNMVSQDGEVPVQEHTDVVAPGYRILHQGNSKGDWRAQARVTGTSEAAPIVAGNIALAMQKHPDATPNQILQAVIHHTGSEPHPLDFDATLGYGVVVTETLLAADPTQYPDVNPLVTNFAYIVPRVIDIWDLPEEEFNYQDHEELGITPPYPIYTPEPVATTSPTPDDEPTPTAVADGPNEPATPPSDDDAGLPGWIIPAAIAAIIILAIITTIIIVTIRSTRTTGGPYEEQ